jgi:hypothetical protein
LKQKELCVDGWFEKKGLAKKERNIYGSLNLHPVGAVCKGCKAVHAVALVAGYICRDMLAASQVWNNTRPAGKLKC